MQCSGKTHSFFALNLAVYINHQFLKSYKDYITISL